MTFVTKYIVMNRIRKSPAARVSALVAHGSSAVENKTSKNSGSISYVSAQAAGSVRNIGYVLDNTGAIAGAGNDAEFIIGDPIGAIAAVSGLTFFEPTSSGQLNPAVIKESLKSAPLVISQINITTTQGADQFSRPLKTHLTDMSGAYSSKTIPLSHLTRSTDQNNNVKTLVLPPTDFIMLNWQRALSYRVAAGEKVLIDLSIAIAGNRVLE